MVDALAPLKQQGRITEFCCTVAEWYNSESLLKPDNVETCTKGLSWLFIASYFSIWVLTARCSHLGFICTKGVVIFSGGGRGPVRVKFWSATRPWNSGTRLDDSAVARPNGQLRQAGVARGVRRHAPPPEKFWTLVSRKCDLQRFLRFQY